MLEEVIGGAWSAVPGRGLEFVGDSPALRLELTCDDEPIIYCVECFEREFGERESG